jgi:hypothetical protein
LRRGIGDSDLQPLPRQCSTAGCYNTLQDREDLAALGEGETIISSLKTMHARGLILRTVIPSVRGFVAWEFYDDDLFALETFQHFVTAMNGKNVAGCF